MNTTCASAQSDTIAGCLTKETKLSVFNYSNQVTELNACADKNAALAWQKNVSEDLINCCGNNRMDTNFFMDIWSSNPKTINTTDYLQRYEGNENQNISSDSNGMEAPGLTQRFTLGRSSHSGAGTESPLFVGMMLYNSRSNQTYKVTNINKTAVWGHQITVISTNLLNVDIAKGDKMIRIPAVAVGGKACSVGATTINTHFTTKGLNKLRLATSWCMDIEMDKPYKDNVLFPIFVDRNGKRHDTALPVLKINAIDQITQAANLMLFIGNKLTNPAIAVNDFSGGEGMIDAIKGAGNMWDYPAATGFSLINDMQEIIMKEDAMKRTSEWLMLGSLRFLAGMTDQLRKDTKSEILAQDFSTISRGGADKEIITKYDVQGYKVLGKKVMFKEFSELNNANSLGNGIFPDLGILLAMDGLRTTAAKSVPPVEFFNSTETFKV